MRINLKIRKEVKKDNLLEPLKLVLFKCILKMHELAVQDVSVDTAFLKNKIFINPSIFGYLKYDLIAGAEYAVPVEFGSKPHYVNPQLLKDWARRKLGDESLAYPVAKKIAKFGTDAHPFMRPAFHQVKNIWLKRYMKSILK